MIAVSDVLSERSISEYFHLEEALMHSKILDSEQTNNLNIQLSSNSKGIIEDKLRLFLIYYLCHHDVKKQTLNELLDQLLNNENMEKYLLDDANSSKFKIKALQYIVEHKKFLNLAESVMENEEKESKKKQESTGWSAWLES